MQWPRSGSSTQSSDDRFAEGERLHENVSPERWCVTRSDIKRFRREVKQALLAGKIPEDPDNRNPYHYDLRVGPSVYQVTKYFVKEVTADAGGMSYALMLHPEGLMCDLFVTHAWQEGVFEFVDKVLAAWPWGKKHLWCCFLANPQNLDLARLLNGPVEETPFAKAVKNATHVIVVPNRFGSIYTRLWCVLEAYLAATWGKEFVLPVNVSWRRLLRSVLFIHIVTIASFLAACFALFAVANVAIAMPNSRILDGEQLLNKSNSTDVLNLACSPKGQGFRAMTDADVVSRKVVGLPELPGVSALVACENSTCRGSVGAMQYRRDWPSISADVAGPYDTGGEPAYEVFCVYVNGSGDIIYGGYNRLATPDVLLYDYEGGPNKYLDWACSKSFGKGVEAVYDEERIIGVHAYESLVYYHRRALKRARLDGWNATWIGQQKHSGWDAAEYHGLKVEAMTDLIKCENRCVSVSCATLTGCNDIDRGFSICFERQMQAITYFMAWLPWATAMILVLLTLRLSNVADYLPKSCSASMQKRGVEALEVCAAIVSGMFAGKSLFVILSMYAHWSKDPRSFQEVKYQLCTYVLLRLCAILLCLGSVFRFRHKSMQAQVLEELSSQLAFTSVRNASCFCHLDSERILTAIGGYEAEVDETIRVLMHAGAFNQHLYARHRAGSNIQHQGMAGSIVMLTVGVCLEWGLVVLICSRTKLLSRVEISLHQLPFVACMLYSYKLIGQHARFSLWIAFLVLAYMLLFIACLFYAVGHGNFETLSWLRFILEPDEIDAVRNDMHLSIFSSWFAVLVIGSIGPAVPWISCSSLFFCIGALWVYYHVFRLGDPFLLRMSGRIAVSAGIMMLLLLLLYYRIVFPDCLIHQYMGTWRFCLEDNHDLNFKVIFPIVVFTCAMIIVVVMSLWSARCATMFGIRPSVVSLVEQNLVELQQIFSR